MDKIHFDKEKDDKGSDLSSHKARNRFLAPQIIAGMDKVLEGGPVTIAEVAERGHTIKARIIKDGNGKIELEFFTGKKKNGDLPISLTPTEIGKLLGAWLKIPSHVLEEPEEEENSATLIARAEGDESKAQIRSINHVQKQNWFSHVNRAWFAGGAEAEDAEAGKKEPKKGEKEKTKEAAKEGFKDYWPRFVQDDKTTWLPPEIPAKFPVNKKSEDVKDWKLGDVDDAQKEQWAKIFLGLAALRLVNGFFLDNPDQAKGYIPRVEVSIPRKNINDEAKKNTDQNGQPDPLEYDEATLDAARAALMSGRHLLLVGPPGCGKSKLAVLLARAAGKNFMTVTASPHWSTDQVMGHYLPAPDGAEGQIEFSEGHFLKAIQTDKWLIIDEINRAEIDDCFGELFTVLSGQRATLSFKRQDEEGDSGGWLPIRILPKPEETGDDRDQFSEYVVKPGFRLIATMNDKDAARLARLSYALQRRFCTIHVPALPPERLAKLAKEHIKTRVGFYNNPANGLKLPGNLGPEDKDLAEFIWDATKGFIERDENGNWVPAPAAQTMTEQGVLSPAIAKGLIDLMLSMLVSRDGNNLKFPRKKVTDDRRPQLIRSCFLASVNMLLLPQLRSLTGAGDAREQEQLCKVIRGLREFFGTGGNDYQNFLSFDAETGTMTDSGKSMREVLGDALKRVFHGTMVDIDCSQAQG